MLIAMVDLKLQYREIADELQQGFARLFEKTAFSVGGEVASFEREFAQFSGVKHCVGVANGTNALEMMLRAVCRRRRRSNRASQFFRRLSFRGHSRRCSTKIR